jgi:hypothetical protein
LAPSDRLWLELPDHPDLGLQPLLKSVLNGTLSVSDQSAYVSSGGAAEIHHDVCVDVRDLRSADPETLQSALVD